ncbi:hypothetical protein J3R30DRAFT_3402671 [Lentinula aciculospora]|uniref:Nephrocystin 3-like N-terminal domain-containing protein n=1 Tax=Lentinula aciculospora TaxID=153920 RepID=A0A9W9DRN5_9AGAR|nr:hypothetical protein J3R30DRAFT_3402671 [Lentinula aciculospora]
MPGWDWCIGSRRHSNWFDEGEEPIYWLNGAAGMGKTTIALSVSHRLLSNRQFLVGRFFCSREYVYQENSGNIFSTIARQLASCNQDFQNILVEVLARDTYVGSTLTHEQFQRLIVKPLQKLNRFTTVILVLDAIDEFTASDLQRRSFWLFSNTFILHSDLRLYYHQRLEEIRIAKQVVPASWPSEELIEKLVEQAAELFIFAVTVCKYLDSRGDARRRLEHITSLAKGEYENALSVDMLYTEVLSGALRKIPDARDRQDFARVLTSVMLAQEPLTINALEKLLDISLRLYTTSFTMFIPSFPYLTNLVHYPPTWCIPFTHLSQLERHISKALRYAIFYWADHFSFVVLDELRQQGNPLLERLREFEITRLMFWFECICLIDAAESVLGILMDGVHSLKSQSLLPIETFLHINQLFGSLGKYTMQQMNSFRFSGAYSQGIYISVLSNVPPTRDLIVS